MGALVNCKSEYSVEKEEISTSLQCIYGASIFPFKNTFMLCIEMSMLVHYWFRPMVPQYNMFT